MKTGLYDEEIAMINLIIHKPKSSTQELPNDATDEPVEITEDKELQNTLNYLGYSFSVSVFLLKELIIRPRFTDLGCNIWKLLYCYQIYIPEKHQIHIER